MGSDDPILYGRRARLRDLAEREAQGHTFWTADFSEEVRNKVLYSFLDSMPHSQSRGFYFGRARALILRNEGYGTLADLTDVSDDFLTYFSECDSFAFLTVVEACLHALYARWPHSGSMKTLPETFKTQVRTILREHRVSFTLPDTELVPFSSFELHVEVVEPTLSLLRGSSNFADVETAYRDALGQITLGDPRNAITDAGTALQQLLVALGCGGNQLGDLIRSAKAKGYFANHDATFVDGLLKIMNWVAADRSELGDSHSVRTPTLDDAWLTVHVVGALILRLSDPERRSKSKS